MNYSKMTPVLMDAIKEQQKQIEEQKNHNLQLQKQINDIKSKLNSLK